MTHDGRHITSDVVTVFARHGVAISTIARAMVIPPVRVENICRRAIENDELQMMPPTTPDDARHALLSELTNLRAALDVAQAELRDLRGNQRSDTERYAGVARLTRSEAMIVATILKTGHATKGRIFHALYPHEEERDPKIVDVLVCKTRAKLKRHNIEIGTHWGVGYLMTPENIQRFKALADSTTLETIAAPRLAPTQKEMTA